MTVYTTNTPKFKANSKNTTVIETRVIGVEVICGTIETTFLYLLDATVNGGANIMIEVQRQGVTFAKFSIL